MTPSATNPYLEETSGRRCLSSVGESKSACLNGDVDSLRLRNGKAEDSISDDASPSLLNVRSIIGDDDADAASTQHDKHDRFDDTAKSAALPNGKGEILNRDGPVPSSTNGDNVDVLTDAADHVTDPLTSGGDPTSEPIHDLICVGFGPASLAIAIALADTYPSSSSPSAAIHSVPFTTVSPSSPSPSPLPPTTLFLERQPQFAWHAGMQLPGAKMQISFLKDLATPRNPRSHFTFLNYLHSKGRFDTFVNLGTFLPTRMEYEDYLRWCAGHFEAEGRVRYGEEVVGVEALREAKGAEVEAGSEERQGETGQGKVKSWRVTSIAVSTGERITRTCRHVVIAVGGRPSIPAAFPQHDERVVHSSRYSWSVGRLLPERERRYRIVVVGGGQSSAEIFADLMGRYPNADISLVIKGAALRPSDDSPL